MFCTTLISFIAFYLLAYNYLNDVFSCYFSISTSLYCSIYTVCSCLPLCRIVLRRESHCSPKMHWLDYTCCYLQSTALKPIFKLIFTGYQTLLFIYFPRAEDRDRHWQGRGQGAPLAEGRTRSHQCWGDKRIKLLYEGIKLE